MYRYNDAKSGNSDLQYQATHEPPTTKSLVSFNFFSLSVIWSYIIDTLTLIPINVVICWSVTCDITQ